PILLCFDAYFKNFPKKYVEKAKGTAPKKIFGNRFGGPDLVTYDVHPDDYVPTEKLPWLAEAKIEQNVDRPRRERFHPNVRRFSYKMPPLNRDPPEKWLYFVGDRVEVLSGKDKGKQGIVCEIIRERDWIYVDGLNLKYETIAPQGFAAQTIGVAQKLDLKNDVALVDPSDEQKTVAEWKYTAEGEKVRVSSRTGRIIPIPQRSFETFEYKTVQTYRETPVDTPAKLMEKVTFSPQLCTFEEEIMQEYNIKDDRKFGKTYFH
uniref:Large ribosomal subunit protein uL24m n=1 Tax=Romanomermis culicivorax TaxID=13658 RepID=A0A915KS64_ROMCU